ncbi:MAG: DeoR/GlpR family DNA-binding transcription regulator [Spirochaetota bacterium]
MNIRQSQLLELLEKNSRVSVEEIKRKFNVSEMTVRRDFALLESMGYADKVQGGIAARRRLFFDSSYSQRESRHVDEKKAIAKKAVELIRPGEKIILDTGTTTLYIARELVKREVVLTVATTSLAAAGVLYNSNIEVLIFGGFLRREIPDLIGPLTEKNLQGFHAHKLFMGCDGVMVEEGFYTSDLNISHIEEIMVCIADKVIVVTDSSKFGRKSFVKYADISRIHTIITDSGISPGYAGRLEEKGVEVIEAEVLS